LISREKQRLSPIEKLTGGMEQIEVIFEEVVDGNGNIGSKFLLTPSGILWRCCQNS